MDSPLDTVDWPVRTERLSLRRVQDGDVEATWTFRRLDEVSRWITMAPQDLESYRAMFTEEERLAKTLVVELDGVVVGDLMLAVEDAWAQSEVREQARGTQAELGWTIDPMYGGKGLATEAVIALVDLSFGPLGLRRVVANCFADNEASWRLMERIGMRREAHTVRESLHRDLGWIDGLSYALLADEWAARRHAS
ncbi:MAG TPA: GNAT family protein [Nocardioidaceae bacterium]|nr:GNAT family protein [Nocardioidaceae bacterium]